MPYRKDITNEQVIDLYFNKGLNRRQTAEYLKCSQDLVSYRLKQLELLPKLMSDCVEAGKKLNISFTKEFLEILDGEMLGDGCILKYKNQGSFRESFGFDKIEWAQHIFDLLKLNNIPIIGDKIYKREPSGKSNNISWGVGSNNVWELGDAHRRWYVKNINYNENLGQGFNNRIYIKTVPKDLILSANCLLSWYIGDATIYNKGGCMIHSEGFTTNEVEFLRYRLQQDFNILTTHRPNNTIYVPFAERIKLLEIMGECPVECYKYKWYLEHLPRKIMPFNSTIDMAAVENFLENR